MDSLTSESPFFFYDFYPATSFRSTYSSLTATYVGTNPLYSAGAKRLKELAKEMRRQLTGGPAFPVIPGTPCSPCNPSLPGCPGIPGTPTVPLGPWTPLGPSSPLSPAYGESKMDRNRLDHDLKAHESTESTYRNLAATV